MTVLRSTQYPTSPFLLKGFLTSGDLILPHIPQKSALKGTGGLSRANSKVHGGLQEGVDGGSYNECPPKILRQKTMRVSHSN